jgi:hypothetical protein
MLCVCKKREVEPNSDLCWLCNSIIETETVSIDQKDIKYIELENEYIEFFSVANMSFDKALKYLQGI